MHEKGFEKLLDILQTFLLHTDIFSKVLSCTQHLVFCYQYFINLYRTVTLYIITTYTVRLKIKKMKISY